MRQAAVDKSNGGITVLPMQSSKYPTERFSDMDYAKDIAPFEESDTRMAETTEGRELENFDCIWVSRRLSWTHVNWQVTSRKPIVSLGIEGNIKVVEYF